MKTIKNSISMKAVLTLAIVVVMAATVNAQTVEEVRTGATGVTYSILPANHNAGDLYRWEITGGTITAVNAGSVVGNVVDFTANATEITVDWDVAAPGSAIASASGEIRVQKRTASGSCESSVTTLSVNIWNNATATISQASEGVCSGGSASIANLPVALTGAPDGSTDGFAVDYSFTVPTGLDIGGVATSGTVTTDGATVNIPLPASFVNNGSTDLDFVVTLDRMNDDFTGDGTVSGTYTVTVYPVPTTGDIQSTGSLIRR